MKGQNEEKEGRVRMWPFFLLTAVYAVSILSLSFFNWSKFCGLSASEWGDALAGFFSPLVFLWIVYAALAQKSELAMQRSELVGSKKAQVDQALHLSKQAEILEAQLNRAEARTLAEYGPVFFLESMPGNVDGMISMRIGNCGCSIMDVEVSDGFNAGIFKSLEGADGVKKPVQLLETVLAVWGKGEILYWLVPPRFNFEDGRSIKFSFDYTRVDGERVSQEIVWNRMSPSRLKTALPSRIEINQ